VGELVLDDESTSRRDQLLSCFKEDSSLMQSISNIPPEMQLMSEAELGKIFRVTPMDYALKKQLWNRFYEVEKSGSMRLKMVDIYGGICSNQYFYNELTKNPARVAWLIVPPIDTDSLIEEAFRFSFEKVRDGILNMPITEKSAPIILKAFQYFADRHLGPMVQRLETKNMNIEVDGGKMNQGSVDPYEIEEKLRELRAKLLPSKDVTPKDE
jgi:hypothetical protein